MEHPTGMVAYGEILYVAEQKLGTHHLDTPSQHILLMHAINTPLNKLSQHTLSTHTLSTHPVNKRSVYPINTTTTKLTLPPPCITSNPPQHVHLILAISKTSPNLFPSSLPHYLTSIQHSFSRSHFGV